MSSEPTPGQVCPARTFARMRGRGKGTTIAAGAAALAVLLTGCGGTRLDDSAIEQAAGIGQAAPLGAGGTDTGGGLPAATDTTGGTQPGAVAPAASGATAPDASVPGGTTGSAQSGAGTGTTAAAGGKNGGGGSSATATTGTGTKPAAGGAPAQATKSTIRVGAVGTFSGPVGALVKDTVTGIRVWQQWVNARGGVNGHPVEVLVGDDGGDPARYVSIQQQFVEQKGAIAFLYGTLGFSPNGNNKYLDSKKIFTLGTEGGLETAYSNPYVLTATPTGKVNADSILLALGDVAQPLGKKKFASFACSDFGLCDNFDQRWSNPDALKAVGFELVARGRPSLTQPDYTSQCLAAKQGGAEVVMLALDTASLRRFAGDCARQNYKPIFGTADLLALSSLPSDPNVNGLIVASKMAPWTDPSVPGIANVTKAFAQYASGALPTGGNTNGWILGRFFESIGRNLPDNPTPADVENGVYQVKNDDLDGMTFPITMVKGKPMPRQLCYGVVVIKDLKYARYPGKALRCRGMLPGAPTSVESASAAPDMSSDLQASDVAITDQAAPSRAALRKSDVAAARRPASDAWLPALPEAVGVTMPVRGRGGARPVTTSRPADTCEPARVAGLAYLLDVLQTGSGAGPGIVYGASLAVLGVALPEPIAGVQAQAIAAMAKNVEQLSAQGPAQVQELRKQVAALAAINDGANGGITSVADGLDNAADTLGPVIQPADTTLRELANIMRATSGSSAAC